MKRLKLLFKTSIFVLISCIVCLSALYVYAYLSDGIDIKTSNSFYIYDNKNEIVYQGSGNNEWVNLEDVSDYFLDAIISTEDKYFYKHIGFDYLRIAKSLYTNLKNGYITQGGSTISQQYVKNMYLDFDQTWERKIQEAFLTIKLETHYTKDDILEGYINTINFGQGCYGVSEASKYYFNKKPNELSLEEAIILAGIPKSPNNYNPISNYDKSIDRAKIVAQSMLNNEKIDIKTYNTLFEDEIILHGKRDLNNLQTLMYYQDAVMDELKTLDNVPNSLIESGGLKIYTNLDIKAQTALENSIINNMQDDEVQVASVIIEPDSGKIIALTGGKDYKVSQFNRVTKSKRQVGSTIKPFLYYTALENNMTSASTFISEKTDFVFSNNQTYSPTNYANKYANTDITMAAALAYSDNVYAVKTHLFLGEDKLVNMMKLVGLEEELEEIPSLALGSKEINMLDYANAYNTLANGGYNQDTYLIEKIEDLQGNILYKHKQKRELVLNTNYLYILNEMMSNTYNTDFISYNSPTALSIKNKLTKKYAIKSGSTDNDYWLVGYNPDLLMMVWTGEDNNKEVESNYSKITKNIWADTVENVLIDKENNWYQKPQNIEAVYLDPVSGNYVDDTSGTLFYFLKGTEP
ncbi:MAG: transglycosylase domain-containing protein [Bacilli bacterium]|nr:transglycosylase domain-containing protein [Bacilli bacterium]